MSCCDLDTSVVFFLNKSIEVAEAKENTKLTRDKIRDKRMRSINDINKLEIPKMLQLVAVVNFEICTRIACYIAIILFEIF